MQKLRSNKPNEPDSFLKVLFSTLARVGNILIIAFGLIFYGIRKLVYAIKKQKHEQTLYEFITELDKHLNPSGKSHAAPPKRTPYSAAKVPPVRTITSAPVTQKPNEFTKVPQKIVRAKSKKHGIALNIPIKKLLPKLVIATVAAAVIISSIFVFKGFADKKKEDLIIEPQLPMLEAAPATAEAGLNLNMMGTSIGELMPQQDYGTTLKTIEQCRSDNTIEVCPDETEGTTTEDAAVTEAEQTIEAEQTTETTGIESEPTATPGELTQDIMLHVNDTNPIVPQVQEALMDLHYMDADEPTDFYGQQTEYAIQLFQRGHGLMVDGVAGYETLTLLFSDEATPYLVRKGDYGFDIYVIKKRLIELGYLDDGDTDKNFNEDTDYAVRVFQGRNKLSQDGIIGHETIQVLLNGDAKPASNYKAPTSDGGTTSDSGGGGSSASYDANSASDFVAFAKSIMNKGYTYIWGGKGPPGMDCSGFVYYCLNQTGNKTGYMTSAAWAQSSYTTISSIHDAKPGDILCFDGHVAICIGGGKMIDSSSSSNAIRIANYESSSYWNKKWVCAKRYFD